MPRGRPRKLSMGAEVNTGNAMVRFDSVETVKKHVKQERQMDDEVDAMVPFGFPVDKVMKPLKSEEEQVAANSNHSRIQWAWKRQSFQGKKARVDLYVHFNFLDQIKTQLTDINRPKMYDEFASSCFGPFLHFSTEGNLCCTALHALLGREVTRSDSDGNDEFWFQIGGRFARFSRYEFALVTGLRFGDSGFDPNAPHVIPSNGVYARRVARPQRRVFVKDIYKRFVRGDFADSVADQVKIAKILFVYKILFGVATHVTSVSDWVWALIEDDEAWESFPWGKFSYQVLSHWLRGLPISHSGGRLFRYRIHGFSPALLIWAYEAIPQLGLICGDRIDDEDLQRPRLIRWRMNPKKFIDVTDFFDRALECHERLEPSAEELNYFARHCVDDDLGAGIQYVHQESSTFVGGRVDIGGSGRIVRSMVGRGRRRRRHVRGSRRAPLRGDRDEVDPPAQVKRARVVLQDENGTSDPSSELLQRIMVMFTNDVECIINKITRLEMLALGKLDGLERRVDILERFLERSRSVVEDKSAAGNNSTRDEGNENNSPENIVAIESGINNDEKGQEYILPDQTVEETCNDVRRNEATNSRPAHGRLPCYGWIESEDEDEDDFVFLKPAHQAVTGGIKSWGRRRSRFDLKPGDPY